MTSPRSRISPSARGCKSGHEPTARTRFSEMMMAPFSMGGRETGRIVRARRIIGECWRQAACNRKVPERNHVAGHPPFVRLNGLVLAALFGAGGDLVFCRLAFA